MRRLVILAAALIWFGACSGPQQSSQDDDGVIGQPPSPEDDPFGFVTMPVEAQRADTSGVIGAPATPGQPAPRAKTPEAAKKTSATEPKTSSKAPVEVARAAPAKPERVRPRSSSAQCFSCVRVCPIVNGRADCGAIDDVICGWGVHPETTTAKRLAKAECNAALEMAREMPRYRTIEGSCPIATCE